MARQALAPAGYERRKPESTALYKILQQHLETFLACAEEDPCPSGLPAFVKQELRDYLTCGILSGGFARLYCHTCGDDMLVPLSCKGRGICPSCGGRRMADTAAHLVDRVLPNTPVRQFVLTLPFPLRIRMGYDADLTSAVLAVFIRAVSGFYLKLAARKGIRGARGGAVTSIQRHGSALNLNTHFHSLFLDGVYTRPDPDGPIRFHALGPLSDEDVERLLETIRKRGATRSGITACSLPPPPGALRLSPRCPARRPPKTSTVPAAVAPAAVAPPPAAVAPPPAAPAQLALACANVDSIGPRC